MVRSAYIRLLSKEVLMDLNNPKEFTLKTRKHKVYVKNEHTHIHRRGRGKVYITQSRFLAMFSKSV